MKLEAQLARREALFQVAKLAENAHALAAVCALVMKAQRPEDPPLLEDALLASKNCKLEEHTAVISSAEEISEHNKVTSLPSPQLARCILADSLRGNTRGLMEYIEASQGHLDEPHGDEVDSDEDDASETDDCEELSDELSETDWWNPGAVNDEDGYAPDCPCD